MVNLAVALIALVALSPAALHPQRGRATDLDLQVTDYVDTFISGLSNIVAEEDYVQRSPGARLTRRLHSQLLLVRPAGTGPFVVYRDVLEVDGQRVTDHAERLEQLFTTNNPDRQRQAERLTAEGARFNLKGVGTLNNPLLGVAMIQARYLSRFEVSQPRRASDLGPEVWELRYTERQRPTLLRTASDADLPAQVIVAANERTGRVVRTELRAGRAQIVTLFGHDPRLDIDVPTEMRDSYSPENVSPTFGEAHYSRFRRFTVATDETVITPTPDR